MSPRCSGSTRTPGSHSRPSRRWRPAPDIDGLSGFSLGLLHEFEFEQELFARNDFVELWPGVQARRTRRPGSADGQVDRAHPGRRCRAAARRGGRVRWCACCTGRARTTGRCRRANSTRARTRWSPPGGRPSRRPAATWCSAPRWPPSTTGWRPAPSRCTTGWAGSVLAARVSRPTRRSTRSGGCRRSRRWPCSATPATAIWCGRRWHNRSRHRSSCSGTPRRCGAATTAVPLMPSAR